MGSEAQRHAVKSAAEIRKGDMPILALSEEDVMRHLDPRELLSRLSSGFQALARGAVQSPHRPEITIPGKGFSLAMPAYMEGMNIAVKVVNVFEGNLAINLPNHLATITLFDAQTGAPVCIMDGTYITAVRTAASAVLSVGALARKNARVATIIGAGVQGREHLLLLPLVGDFTEIRIASLEYEDAEKLARLNPKAIAVRDVEAAVRTSDIVCLASHSYTPVIEAGWVRAGTHVTSVGYAPPHGELPVELLEKASLFVESLEAFEGPPVGCGELCGIDPGVATTLGDMLSRLKSGRQLETDITVYKAMGIAMEDMIAADIAYRHAKSKKIGQVIVL
ncbi:ornithine cyclodeaminase family protein [Labrys sp. KB_33_2]|uniref:ornithine cyclodeaminase family protein n=1 Tax=Labrys sp. KB_33_2 TaxID=3237479 RepID=UPI003F8DC8B0